MKYCYLVLIFLFCTVCKAQQPTHKIDSLQRALQNHTKKDSVRVKMLVELFMSKFYGSPDSSLIKYPEEALVISRAIDFKKGIALSYGRMGIYYQYLKGDSKKGLSYYYKVLTYLDSIKDPSLQVWKIKNEVLMYGNIANINSDMGSFKKSIEFQHKALSLSQKNNLPVPVQLYTNLGIAYLQLKNYAQSEAYLRLALNNAEQNKDFLNQAVVLSNLSICLLRQQKTTEALSSIKKSLLLNETLKSDLVSSSALINAGVIYTTLGDYEKAEQFDKQALVFSKKFGYQMMEREALFALYENYVKQENYKDA
jgi:tetratricopeptide (TPR) repeat protein